MDSDRTVHIGGGFGGCDQRDQMDSHKSTAVSNHKSYCKRHVYRCGGGAIVDVVSSLILVLLYLIIQEQKISAPIF